MADDSAPAPASLPEGLRVYAVGDIHGCLDRLRALEALMAEDAARAPEPRRLIVHLGDYVDRGPDSSGVIERLSGPPPFPAETVHLLGNHEAMMRAALAAPEDLERVGDWIRNGGSAALASWGIDIGTEPETWEAAIPPAHRRFIERLTLMHRLGGYLFVHAGVRPRVPLERQDPEDLIWIREPFLSSKADHGAVVVHGHTPVEAPVIRRNRIGLDTGAVYGRRLTCAVLWADRLRFLQA